MICKDSIYASYRDSEDIDFIATSSEVDKEWRNNWPRIRFILSQPLQPRHGC